MQKFNGQLINQFPNNITGNAAAGAQVTVRVKQTGALATLYATDSTAGATLANPIIADSRGYYGFFAADGVYTLDVNISGTPQLVIQLQDVAALKFQFDNAVSNAGYIPVGTFTAGCTIAQVNGVVSDGTSFWRWDGALPKTVTAGSAPTPTGVGGWVLIGGGNYVESSILADVNSPQVIAGMTAKDLVAKAGSAEGAVKADDLEPANSDQVISGFLAKQLQAIDGVKGLVATAGVAMTVKGFYAGINIGGGSFYYDPSISKANHNGGTFIAPEALAAWDGTSANIATLLNWTGAGAGCFVRIKQTEKLYPEFFGALGNAIMNCTLPIKKAIAAVVNGIFANDGDPVGELGFNYGVYRITESGVFTQVTDNKRAGITCSGAGPYNTLIWLDPSSFTGDAWFYDNGATSRSWNLTFRDMGFSGGTTWRNLSVEYVNFVNRVKGFKFSGPGWESGHVFDNCLFSWLDTIVEAAGSNNADTLRFSNCTAIKCRLANYINNPQSMSITWVQCYLSNHFGDFAQWGSGVFGAGDLTFTDGAIIFTPDDYGAGTCYILNMLAGAPTAGNGAINIQGRFELRGVGSRIAAHGNALGSPVIKFDASSFLHTTTTNRKLVTIGDYCDLSFMNSTFFSTSAVTEFEIVNGARRGKQGTIKFSSCFLDDIEKFNFTFPNGKGYVEIMESWDRLNEFADSAVVKSINGVYSGSDLNANLANRPNKEYRVNPLNGNLLPYRLTNEAALILPAGSILTRVYVVLPPNATSATPNNYRLFVGNNAKTVVYAQSTTVLQNAGFVLNVDIAVKLGSTISDRTVRLWADDGAGGAGSAGVCTPLLCNIYYQ